MSICPAEACGMFIPPKLCFAVQCVYLLCLKCSDRACAHVCVCGLLCTCVACCDTWG